MYEEDMPSKVADPRVIESLETHEDWDYLESSGPSAHVNLTVAMVTYTQAECAQDPFRLYGVLAGSFVVVFSHGGVVNSAWYFDSTDAAYLAWLRAVEACEALQHVLVDVLGPHRRP